MNKQVNYDFKTLNNCLDANKICLNVGEIEVVLFKSLTIKTFSDLHIKLNGKQLYPTDSTRYLGIIIEKNLNWRHKISNVAAKLNKANAMLSKIRHFVNFNTLKSIYHAILESHLNYSLTVWAQNANSIKRLLVLQKKSLRIMHFLKRNAHTSNLFKNLNILKLPDKVSLENCILICKYFNQSLPKSFENWLTLATVSHTSHTYSTR